MTPDPRWLEILKASGWQTTGLAAAFGVILMAVHAGWMISPDPWFTAFCGLAFAITLFLALASIGHALTDLLQPKLRFTRWMAHRVEARRAREYIPHMTEQERHIIAHLLERNQKSFLAASDAGHAVTLLSRGIITFAVRQGQIVHPDNVPMIIPDHVWDVLAAHKDQFAYTQAGDGSDPWRVNWMAR